MMCEETYWSWIRGNQKVFENTVDYRATSGRNREAATTRLWITFQWRYFCETIVTDTVCTACWLPYTITPGCLRVQPVNRRICIYLHAAVFHVITPSLRSNIMCPASSVWIGRRRETGSLLFFPATPLIQPTIEDHRASPT